MPERAAHLEYSLFGQNNNSILLGREYTAASHEYYVWLHGAVVSAEHCSRTKPLPPSGTQATPWLSGSEQGRAAQNKSNIAGMAPCSSEQLAQHEHDGVSSCGVDCCSVLCQQRVAQRRVDGGELPNRRGRGVLDVRVDVVPEQELATGRGTAAKESQLSASQLCVYPAPCQCSWPSSGARLEVVVWIYRQKARKWGVTGHCEKRWAWQRGVDS